MSVIVKRFHRVERERDEARMTIEDVRKALRANQNEGPILAALRVVEERDEARAQRDLWEKVALREASKMGAALSKGKRQDAHLTDS